MIDMIKILANSTWKIEDLKNKSTISVYLPNIEKAEFKDLNKRLKNLANSKKHTFYKITNGFLLFQFDYEPLLDIKDFKTIVNKPEEYPLLDSLYDSFLNTYFYLYKSCIQWYKEISLVKGAFDFEEQLKLYQDIIIDDFSCPILKELDPTQIRNLNFKKAFVQLLKKSILEKTTSVSKLLYGSEEFVISKIKYSSEAQVVYNTITNIVYQRFYNFLTTESKLNSNKKTTRKTTKIIIKEKESLKCYFDYQQLKKLHHSLIQSGLIKEIKIETFINCLSGKLVNPNDRIVWRKAKRKACYLFSLISINFKISKLNASVIKINHVFDSNDISKKSYYADLLEILSAIDPDNKNFATIIKK